MNLAARRSGQTTLATRLARLPAFQPLAILGFLILALWIVAAVLAPWLSPHDPISQSADLLQSPSSQHWFGTDQLGRDVFSRVLWGARVTIPLAFILVIGSVAIGATLGAVAGYVGGIADELLMRVTDLVFAFPVILLAMTITAALGPGLQNAVLAVMLVAWPRYARLIRGQINSLNGADFVNASRLLGASAGRTLVIDMLPNIAGPVIALATVNIGTAVLLLASLSFLGLGAQPPAAEWGSMVASSVHYFDRWWLGLFPGLAIFSVAVGSTFLGDSLRDALDPKSSSSRNQGT